MNLRGTCPRPGPRQATLRILGPGFGHRHPRGPPCRRVRELHADRRREQPDARRHGTRVDHLPKTHRSHGRADRPRESAGQGEHVLGRAHSRRGVRWRPTRPVRSTAGPREGSRPLGPLRVLLAEDNPINRKVAIGMVERLGSRYRRRRERSDRGRDARVRAVRYHSHGHTDAGDGRPRRDGRHPPTREGDRQTHPASSP